MVVIKIKVSIFYFLIFFFKKWSLIGKFSLILKISTSFKNFKKIKNKK